MCAFYCIALRGHMFARKSISNLNTNMESLDFRLKKIDQTKSYLLEEIKHNNFMIPYFHLHHHSFHLYNNKPYILMERILTT